MRNSGSGKCKVMKFYTGSFEESVTKEKTQEDRGLPLIVYGIKTVSLKSEHVIIELAKLDVLEFHSSS